MNLTFKQLVVSFIVFISMFYIFSIMTDCRSEQFFESAVKRDGMECSRIKFIRYGGGIGSSARFIYNRFGKVDTAADIMSCNDYRKWHGNYSQKLWFGFYTASLDFIVPVRTWEQYRRLQKYFPDSAAIMDTAYLY